MKADLERSKVSIIIPTYNSGQTLAKCLKSVYDQTYLFYEVIIIDNFSSDDTPKVAKDFGVRIIQQKSNPASARNIGIASSIGRCILFLDSDQVLSPQVVEECIEKCENEEVGMVKIPEVFIGRGFWGVCSAVWKNCYEEIERSHRNSQNIIRGEPRFFIRENIIRVGMLDNSLLWGEDFNLYEKLKNANVKEAFCESKIYHFELVSLRDILIKNLRYAKSMPIFLQQTRTHIFPLMLRHALLTLSEVFRNFKKSPAIIVGCVALLCLKIYSIGIGGLRELLFSIYKNKRFLGKKGGFHTNEAK